MAQKREKILEDLVEFNKEYHEIFERWNINFIRWLDKVAKDYNTLQKANKFVFTHFMKRVKDVHAIWKLHPKQTWEIMLIQNKNCDECVELHHKVHMMRLIWQNRTPYKRKGSE